MDCIKEFCDCYDEFEDFFRKQDDADNIPTYILFGVSGAGKSTLLARLRSPKRPVDFCKDVIDRKEKFVVEEDVKIGAKKSSTTVVPRRFHVKSQPAMNVYDVPGFEDTEENMKQIIRILHKCLLNKVQHADKYLIVIEASLIFASKLVGLKTHYYARLKELFGDRFVQNLAANCLFVITKHDMESEKKIGGRSVKEAIQEATDDLAEGMADMEFQNFLIHLRKKHIVVDYKQHSGSTLRSLLESAEKKTARRGKASKIGPQKFNVTSNRIVGQIRQEMKSLHQNLNKRLGAAFDAVAGARKAIAQIQGDIQDAAREIKRLDKSTLSDRKFLEESEAKIIMKRKEIKDTLTALKVLRIESENLNKFKGTMIDYMQKAVCTRITQLKPTHDESTWSSSKYILKVGVTSKGSYNILMTQQEIDPEEIKDVASSKRMGGKHVLANNNIVRVRGGNFKYSHKAKGDVFFIIASHSAPFTAYMVEERGLERKAQMDLSGGILQKHENKLKAISADEKRLEILESEISMVQADQKLRKKRIAAQVQVIGKLKSEVIENKKKSRNSSEEWSARLKDADKILKKFRESVTYRVCEKAIGILQRNNLSSDVGDEFERYKKALSNFIGRGQSEQAERGGSE